MARTRLSHSPLAPTPTRSKHRQSRSSRIYHHWGGSVTDIFCCGPALLVENARFHMGNSDTKALKIAVELAPCGRPAMHPHYPITGRIVSSLALSILSFLFFPPFHPSTPKKQNGEFWHYFRTLILRCCGCCGG